MPNLNLITYLNRTLSFEWYVAIYGSNSKYQNDVYLKVFRIHVQNM